MKSRFFSRLVAFALLLMAFSLMSLDIAAQSKKDQKRSLELIKNGDKAFSQKNYRFALDSYSQAATLTPNNAYAHYRKGFAHYYLKEADLAIPEFDIALAKGYKPVEIYRVRWLLLYEKKNFKAAAQDLNQLVASEPDNADYRIALADINYDSGSYKEAADGYQKAILKNPNRGDLFYKLALAKSKLGDIEGQASAAEEAIKKNTLFLAESYLLIADARQKQKRNAEAIAAYESAIKSKPDLNSAYRNLGELYRAENRINEAIEISKAGLRIFPNDGNIFTDITWFYSLAEKTEEAIEAGRAATRLLPNQALGYTNLCRAYNEAKKPEMAINACNTALRLSPNDGETNFYIGRSNALLQKPAEANKYYKRAVVGLIDFTNNNPDYSDGFYLLGNAYAEDGQSAKALEAYKKCLELNPRFAKAQFNIGVIFIGKKDKNGAMEQYNALMNTDKVLAGKLKVEIDKL